MDASWPYLCLVLWTQELAPQGVIWGRGNTSTRPFKPHFPYPNTPPWRGLQEVTRTHIPLDMGLTKGTAEVDSWLLAVTLLEKLGLIKIGMSQKWMTKDVVEAASTVTNSDLRHVFKQLLAAVRV